MRINGTKRKNHPATRKRRKLKIRLDIPGRKIETVEHTQQVDATGTALVVAAGLKGDDVLELSRRLVKVDHVYVPDPGTEKYMNVTIGY
jgi:hypothetical protein